MLSDAAIAIGAPSEFWITQWKLGSSDSPVVRRAGIQEVKQHLSGRKKRTNKKNNSTRDVSSSINTKPVKTIKKSSLSKIFSGKNKRASPIEEENCEAPVCKKSTVIINNQESSSLFPTISEIPLPPQHESPIQTHTPYDWNQQRAYNPFIPLRVFNYPRSMMGYQSNQMSWFPNEHRQTFLDPSLSFPLPIENSLNSYSMFLSSKYNQVPTSFVDSPNNSFSEEEETIPSCEQSPANPKETLSTPELHSSPSLSQDQEQFSSAEEDYVTLDTIWDNNFDLPELFVNDESFNF